METVKNLEGVRDFNFKNHLFFSDHQSLFTPVLTPPGSFNSIIIIEDIEAASNCEEKLLEENERLGVNDYLHFAFIYEEETKKCR
mgnify:CR=1 FL=1